MVFFCLPETLDPAKMKPLVPTPEPLQPGEKANEMTRVTTTQSVHIKTKRFAAVLKRFFIDPLSIMAFFCAFRQWRWWFTGLLSYMALYTSSTFLSKKPSTLHHTPSQQS